jgi:hypothetical protein
LTFWTKDKQDKPTKHGLPLFTVDTLEEANTMLVLVGQYCHYPGGGGDGKEWGYRFTGWNVINENNDINSDLMDAEFDRARKIMTARYIKVRKNKGDGR